MSEVKPPLSSSETTSTNECRKSWSYLRRVMGTLGVAGVVYGGGVLATNAHPTEGAFHGIKTSISMSPNPNNMNTVFDQTGLGELRGEFSPSVWMAPGIQVSSEITPQALSNRTVIEDIQDHPEKYKTEAAEYAKDQMIDLTKTFASGGLLTAAILSAGWALNRHSTRSWKEKITVTGAGTATAGLALAASLHAYMPDNYQKFQATGLIAQGLDTPDLLSAATSRRIKNFEPYLNGWLALGNLAKNKLATPEQETANGPKILLVSDIHGTNLYPMMKQIITANHIDAVVDSGDLINFGQTEELDIAGMRQGIESLGVPYLFVTGNHDSSAKDDRSLLAALATIPNVHLLQPKDDTYSIVSVDGVRVAGMNDLARWYGDDDIDTDSKQLPYAKQFNKAMKDQQPIDLAVAHQSGAIKAMTVGVLRDYGHTHVSSFDGKAINPGTFSGGDPIRRAAQLEAEQQPSSMAILSYDSTCTPTQLTRYAYTTRDNIPVLTSINIETITTTDTEVGKDRTCGSGGVSETSVAVVASK